MNDNEVVVRLTGVITANEYRKAVTHFVGLVNALTEAVADKVDVEWQLTDLDYGSAIMQFSGFANSQNSVRQVVAAYSVATQAAARRETIPYPAAVRTQLEALTSLINGHISAIEFSTSTVECVVTAPLPSSEEFPTKSSALGSIRRRVQMISERSSLYFNLYDSIFDEAVRCNMLTEQQEMMRDIWGKYVIVTGTVTRDKETGQPRSIHDILDIEVVNLAPRQGYRRVRGILEYNPNDPPSHQRLRRHRAASITPSTEPPLTPSLQSSQPDEKHSKSGLDLSGKPLYSSQTN